MGGGPRFFVFLDAADRGAIGVELYYQAKVGSFRDSIRVLRESIGDSVIVLSFYLFVCEICSLWYNTGIF